MTNQVRNNAEQSRYELEAEGGVTYATYRREGDTLFITHTVTPQALRGKGLASRLVKGMLADLRSQGLRIVPQCSFIVDYLARHPEERDLVAH